MRGHCVYIAMTWMLTLNFRCNNVLWVTEDKSVDADMSG